jgi:hypothetical protein
MRHRVALVAVLITRRHLIDSLAQELEQRMIRMPMPVRSWIINQRLYTAQEVEPLINLPQEKKAGVGGDLCAPEINADGGVKFRPYGPSLLVTNCAHKAFPPP